MTDINTLTLSGFIATEIKGRPITTKAGKDTFLAEFRLGFKSDWRKDTKPTFITVKVWGVHGKFVADYAARGMLISAHGKIQEETWTGSDGAEQSRWVLNAETVVLPRKPRDEREPRRDPDRRLIDYKHEQEEDTSFEPQSPDAEEMPF